MEMSDIKLEEGKKDKKELNEAPTSYRFFRSPTPFWFPRNVNIWTSRLIALQVVVLCIVCIILRDRKSVHYTVLAQAIDYILRILGGARMSVQGTLADMIAWYLPRKLTAGPPKQFAAFCGFMFSGLATITAFADDTHVGMAVCLGMLAGAAFLEFALDFCLGCFMFKYMVKFGLIPEHVIHRCNDTYDEMQAVLDYEDQRLKEGAQREVTINFPNSKYHLRYKQKTDEQTLEDFHIIKHCDVSFFGACMGLTGHAVVWKFISAAYNYPEGIWKAFAIFSAVIFGIVIIIYILRIALYGNKVMKEWYHPVKSNFFGAIPINFLLFSILAVGDKYSTAEALFWISAPVMTLFAVLSVTRWISTPQYKEHLNPAWMIPPLGNLVAAIVAPSIDTAGAEVGWLWFSFAYLMYIALFAVTLHRVIFNEKLVDRLRPTLWIFVAAPAVATSAYVALNAGWDNFARFNFYTTVIMFSVMTVLTFDRFFGIHKFEMGYWGLVFPLDTVALVTIQYQMFVKNLLTQVISYFAISIATFVVSMCILHTVMALLRRKIFIADEKWGPTSFMKLTHEAFKNILRTKLPQLLRQIKDEATPERLQKFSAIFDQMYLVHKEHARHEDDVVFPSLRSFFPASNPHLVSKVADEQHEADHKEFRELKKLISTVSKLEGEEKQKALSDMISRVEELCRRILAHFKVEEDDLIPIGKKYHNLQTQKKIIRQVWESSTFDAWNVYIPFVVNHLPYPGQRVRFLKCLRWAMPENSQVIGRIVYDGVSTDLWDRITADFPEIIPREVSGYTRYY